MEVKCRLLVVRGALAIAPAVVHKAHDLPSPAALLAALPSMLG